MESFHVESSSFIQNLKAFNISNARQLVSVYCRHVESLGSFQYFQCQATSVNVVITNTKKEKVRNQTTYMIHNKVQQKKRKEEEAEEEEEEAVTSWHHLCFVVIFFLFSFSVFFYLFILFLFFLGLGSMGCFMAPPLLHRRLLPFLLFCVSFFFFFCGSDSMGSREP